MYLDYNSKEPGSVEWQSELIFNPSDGTRSHCTPLLECTRIGIPYASTGHILAIPRVSSTLVLHPSLELLTRGPTYPGGLSYDSHIRHASHGITTAIPFLLSKPERKEKASNLGHEGGTLGATPKSQACKYGSQSAYSNSRMHVKPVCT